MAANSRTQLYTIDEAEQQKLLAKATNQSYGHNSHENDALRVPYADEEEDYDLDDEIAATFKQPQDNQPTESTGLSFHADLPLVIQVHATHSGSRPSSRRSSKASSKHSSTADLNKQADQSDSSGRATPEILANVEIRGRNLRRNSISMPSGINALDLEALRMNQVDIQDTLHEEEKSDDAQTDSVPDVSGSTVSLPQENSSVPQDNAQTTTINIPKNDDEDSDDALYGDIRRPKVVKDRFRSRRRASIAPLPALRLNSREMLASDYDTHSLASNQASITSINSIASLLREKMQAFPQMIRKKKRETKDYKLRIFVLMMFFIIVFLIGFAYVGYHEQVLARSYFEKIKFKTHDRVLRILDQDEKEIIFGHLGTSLGADMSPFHCLEEHRRNDGSVCMEWSGIARLYMNFQNKDVFRCYTLQWQALRDDVYPTDCYELRRDNGLWFGGAMTKGSDWSLSTANFDFAPFISGDARVHQFGNGVKRYFINSIGVALQVNEQTPLYIAANRSENRLCLQARNDDFSFVNRLTPLPELDYKICTMPDMRSLHMLLTQQSLWDGLKEDDIQTLRSLLEEPIWKIPYTSDVQAFNETTIYNYSEQVIDIGYMLLGHILINEFWQENIGDFTVDRKRFPTLVDTIDVLHRRGFKVVFTIQPFISTDSPNFRDAVAKKLLIYERHSERSIPAMTRYKSASSAGIIDITNNASIPWLLEKLQRLKSEFKVDSFFLDLGNAYNLPHYYQCRQTLDNPDMYARLFTSSLESIGFIGVSSASVVPKPPSFLATPPINSSWSGLREVLATVLNYGIIGYPFVLPGAIGGDFQLNSSLHLSTKMTSFYSLGQAGLPEQELYVRWLQLMTFLPAMQFSHLPSEYRSDYVTEIAKDLTAIRKNIVNGVFRKYMSDSMNEGIPLVRPLWMLDAHDPQCLLVSDEFSVGAELIVAPILERGVTEREVYLPQGVWKDGIDGSLRKGSRWMHSYKVPRDKIAYFVKMPDDTRF